MNLRFANNAIEALLHLFFPKVCPGCSSDQVDKEQMICADCLSNLPYTGFQNIRDNSVEKLFWGRCNIKSACSIFYYIVDTPLQHIIHHIKYKNQPELGIYMGEIMGHAMNNFFSNHEMDLIIPMPLHPKKEYQRGYNQASLLCRGISSITGIEHQDEIVLRKEHTSSQTNKTRLERWENVAEVFCLNDVSSVADKHILLIDDVITTGASMEACANILIKSKAASVSICSLAFTIQ